MTLSEKVMICQTRDQYRASAMPPLPNRSRMMHLTPRAGPFRAVFARGVHPNGPHRAPRPPQSFPKMDFGRARPVGSVPACVFNSADRHLQIIPRLGRHPCRADVAPPHWPPAMQSVHLARYVCLTPHRNHLSRSFRPNPQYFIRIIPQYVVFVPSVISCNAESPFSKTLYPKSCHPFFF